MEEQLALTTTLVDTRFTPEWLDAHPQDKAMVDMRAEGRTAKKPDEQRRGEIEQLHARRDHDVWERLPAITCPTA